MSTWDKLESNAPSNAYRKIVKKYIQDPLPKIYQLPYSFYDHDEIRKYLIDAGFENISIDSIEKMAVCETAREAAVGLSYGGSLYNEIMSRNPAWVEEICTTLEIELREKYGNAPMRAPMSAVVCSAFK